MNRQVLLDSRPQGAASVDNFRIVAVADAEPGPGEVLVRNRWLSIDPYMRGRMNDAKSYVPPAKIGEVMVGQTVGDVVASNDARIGIGDTVLTSLGLAGVRRRAGERRSSASTRRSRRRRGRSASSACRG